MKSRFQGVLRIYEQLHDNDQNLSKRKFARDYLGKCESYLFSTKYYGRDISDNALLRLRGTLFKMARAWGELYREKRHDRYLANSSLLEQLTVEAEHILLGDTIKRDSHGA
tara:strand:- start:257 stop:589 length:333 start_codon:yes stop_codon:yes gene_type:complete